MLQQSPRYRRLSNRCKGFTGFDPPEIPTTTCPCSKNGSPSRGQRSENLTRLNLDVAILENYGMEGSASPPLSIQFGSSGNQSSPD